MVIEWSPRAKADLDEIAAYLKQHSPRGAQRVWNRVIERVETLATFPEQAPVSPQTGYRQLFVTRTKYIVIYERLADRVRLVTIVHANQSRRA